MNFKNKRSRGSASRGGCFCGGKYAKKVTGEEKRKYADPPEVSKSLSLSKKSKKKDTKRWCKGKEGREHVTQWEPNPHFGWLKIKDPARQEYNYEVFVCINCRIQLDHRTIHVKCGQVHDNWGMGWYYKNRETGKSERKSFPCETKAA